MNVEQMNELKIMKTLRYLLIVMVLSVASLVFATAQSLAQKPEVQMQSTSGMIGSGSQLPSAAVQGTFVTGSTPGMYSPANAPSRPRRIGEDDDWADDDDPDKPGEPFPIGDAVWPLMLLALAFMLRVYMRARSL